MEVRRFKRTVVRSVQVNLVSISAGLTVRYCEHAVALKTKESMLRNYREINSPEYLCHSDRTFKAAEVIVSTAPIPLIILYFGASLGDVAAHFE